jgi:hypothetical protein
MVTLSNGHSAYVEHLKWWRDIDSMLTQPEFSSLRRVRLRFALDLDQAKDDREMFRILDDILAQFPNLSKQGTLFVEAYEDK